jgi:RHH-type rel operon transcriptional repressor/antitoxin RelB
MPTSIRLSPESEARLNRLAEQTGRSKAFYLRQIIDQGLDDAEDHYLGMQVLERIERGEENTLAWPEVKKQLGLDG